MAVIRRAGSDRQGQHDSAGDRRARIRCPRPRSPGPARNSAARTAAATAPLATSSAPWSRTGLPDGVAAASAGQRDVGVQQRDQGREVAAAGCGEERGGHLPLAGEVAGAIRAGRTRAPGAAPGWPVAASRPWSGRARAATSVNGMANMSCSTNASRSAGVSVSSTTSRARPTESASTASSSGSPAGGRTGRPATRPTAPFLAATSAAPARNHRPAPRGGAGATGAC